MRAPRSVGAIAPTSSKRRRLMASHIDLASDLPVLELGPGTGAITPPSWPPACAPERLHAVEYSAAFCRVCCKDRFPGAKFLQGDAFDLPGHAGRKPRRCRAARLRLRHFRPAALEFPKEKRTHLLQTALSLLEPGRPFVQFSYGIIPPIPRPIPIIAVTRSSLDHPQRAAGARLDLPPQGLIPRISGSGGATLALGPHFRAGPMPEKQESR
jgi:phosphatidylethanolamine/phosphatidyl-N-methylethanolamine N-methyltransferase